MTTMRALMRTVRGLLWMALLAGAPAFGQAAPPAAASAPLPPSYVPGVYGQGLLLGADWQRGVHGWHVWWFWLRENDGAVRSNGLWCMHSDAACPWAPPLLSAALQTCKQAATPMECARTLWSERVRLNCSAVPTGADGEYDGAATGELADVCREHRALRKAYAAANHIPWPAPAASAPSAAPSWAVKPNLQAADGSRPVRTLSGGVLGAATGARVAAGTPCRVEGEATLASGTERWAPFAPDFAAGLVALCAPGQ